jgi:hypothetical protein
MYHTIWKSAVPHGKYQVTGLCNTHFTQNQSKLKQTRRINRLITCNIRVNDCCFMPTQQFVSG